MHLYILPENENPHISPALAMQIILLASAAIGESQDIQIIAPNKMPLLRSINSLSVFKLPSIEKNL